MDIQDIIGSRRGSCDSIGDQSLLRPVGFINRHCSPTHGQNSPSLHRSPSPRRRFPPQQLHHDIGFSDTVSNVVEIVKHEHQRASQRSRFPRAGAVVGIPVHQSAVHQSNMQHSHPSLGGRKGQGRRLPPTPCKPSTLQLRPGSINFPKVNASPTHQQLQSHSAHATPQTHPHSFPRDREPLREITPTVTANINNININPGTRDSTETPLSFEQGVALGRGGRILPSPVPNGFKPRPSGSRHSDSDDDDWC
nr:voltage-dependent calcium channel type A subunit alpha-1-like [Leptinotarsa decemlineata]